MNLTPSPQLISADDLVDEDGLQGPGWILVRRGLIAARGRGNPPGADVVGDTLRDHVATLMPGLVDIHCHGALGVDFGDLGADPEPAVDHHAAWGATTMIATLATASLDTLTTRVRELLPLVAEGRLAGIHLEGPWLSPERRGAHNIDQLRHPLPADIDALLEAAGGALRMVTIAPELPGARAAIDQLVGAGVVVALGHTAADSDTVARAVDAGATVVTHLFNGMPPLHHREPGLVGRALADHRFAVELIADGHHVDDMLVQFALQCAPERAVIISDAMSATGLGDGTYRLAGSDVVVSQGVARTADQRSLAGSVTPLGRSVSRLAQRGMAAEILAAAAWQNPARALGLRVPSLRPGHPADAFALSADGTARTMKAGAWLDSSS